MLGEALPQFSRESAADESFSNNVNEHSNLILKTSKTSLLAGQGLQFWKPCCSLDWEKAGRKPWVAGTWANQDGTPLLPATQGFFPAAWALPPGGKDEQEEILICNSSGRGHGE